ncbi:T9SS type A sorting domain-containing protein [uncultured Aquimarina sp.]|uniref:T9SS type A sorting domain-containing protein n=1 Tax=uncultured Aquimarina sp. TaxID=575652 RepID=UPI002626DA5E|nr:T9SS type A sorting domain-containing protein [uncultured Aquimarina sp.]
MKKIILCTAAILWCMIASSQITNEAPRSSFSKLSKSIPTISMPSFDLKKIQEEDKVNDLIRSKPFRFGHEFDVDLNMNNSGVLEELNNGDQIWRLSIKSEGANTLNFIFDLFDLAEGASVHLYNDDKSFVLGAYTSKMNNDNKSLGTWIADGEKITIEFYEPSNVKGLSKLNIGTVVHGYRTVANYETHLKRLNDSGDCNQDVNCDIGADFNSIKDNVKKGVALILNNGSDWCTGTLINNTSNNAAPYLLTANHCSGGEANWTFRFNWISTNNVCAAITNSTDNGPSNYFQTTSGATVLAQNSETDFELIEITGGLDDSWDLEWAGWDRTGAIPSYTVGIHHPSGDIMKVCRDDNAPEYFIRTFNGNPTTELWRIIGGGANQGWDLGVTEPGSSGSALFDPNGRIIGQLAGGFAACSGTNDNGTEDWYGRFDISWDFGTTNSTRLSNWLDPANTGQTTLDSLSEELLLSVDENDELDRDIALYPNPSDGVFNVANNSGSKLTYDLFNIIGQQVGSGKMDNKNSVLDISSNDSGVYFISITDTSKNTKITKKVVIR